jgi:ATP-dependent exoDNAse (exonuclease V) alpha subunit
VQQKIHLTASQKEAMKQVIDFLESSESCFLLKGYAGTGKTFLIKVIADYLESIDRDFYLAAPTGRASRILSTKTGYDAVTIHSLIYTEEKEDAELQQVSSSVNFALRKNPHAVNTVYIFDEASMITDNAGSSDYLNFGSGRLLFDFLLYAGIISQQSKIPTRRKVIFVGDPAQLPPVKAEYSPALQSAYLNNEYGVFADEVTLIDVIRQSAESPVLQVATPLRNSIQTSRYDVDSFEYPPSLICQPKEFISKWSDAATNDSIDETIVITRSNQSALQYNQAIRRLRYGAGDIPIQPNDRLLVVNNNRLYNLLNGDIVEVIEVSETPEVHIGRNIFKDNEEHELVFRDIVIGWKDAKGVPMELECKIVENLLWSTTGFLPGGEWAAMRNLATEKCGVQYPSKKLLKKKPKEYKELLATYQEALKESPYMNALQVKFGYAVTCHKAQGGEWKNVFIDFKSFGGYFTEEYFRWAYTAVTRTKEELYMLNFPIKTSKNDDLDAGKVYYDYNID